MFPAAPQWFDGAAAAQPPRRGTARVHCALGTVDLLAVADALPGAPPPALPEIEDARHLVPDGRPVWAQPAPGNARGIRAFQAAGYRAVGAEILLLPRDDARGDDTSS